MLQVSWNLFLKWCVRILFHVLCPDSALFIFFVQVFSIESIGLVGMACIIQIGPNFRLIYTDLFDLYDVFDIDGLCHFWS
jgi:hypothetical protein